MPQNNKLRAFTRLDGSLRVVPGSTVLRKKKPVTGRWVENEAYTCCAPSVDIEVTPEDVVISDVVFSLLCDDVEVSVTSLTTDASSSIDDLVAILNANLGYLGVFSTDGTIITLKLKLDIANTLCPEGDLSMTIDGTPTTTTTTTTTTAP